MPGRYEALVFDLDGTLWNACEACADGWTEGLQALGIKKRITKADIESICGLTYPDCVKKLCPEHPVLQGPHEMQTIDDHQRLHVERRGGELYAGVIDGLRRLTQQNNIYLVSNCQEWYLRCFLERTSTEDLFLDWECWGRTGRGKRDNLIDVAKRNRFTHALYIGDTDGDHRAATEAGYDFGFASYGFGHTQNALRVFASFAEVLSSFAGGAG